MCLLFSHRLHLSRVTWSRIKFVYNCMAKLIVSIYIVNQFLDSKQLIKTVDLCKPLTAKVQSAKFSKRYK